MIDWQPISTAPLDGTHVFVYDGYDVWKVYAKYNTLTKKYEWYECSTLMNINQAVFHEPTHWLSISDLLKPLGWL